MLTQELPYLQKKPGVSLVLSGGATKAFYFHLGALRVLQLDEITSVVGSSGGAVMGAFIASGVSPELLANSLSQRSIYVPRFEAWVKTLTSTMLFRPKYLDIVRQSLYNGYSGLRFLASLPQFYSRDILAEGLDRLVKHQKQVKGFFDSRALEDLFRGLLPSTDFNSVDIDLYITATALDSRQRAVFNSRYDFETEDDLFATNVPISRAVRASTCVPGMFEPVKINGKYYYDGEVKRTLSADIGISLADRIIVSHPYQPLYLGEQGRSVNDLGWFNILKQTLHTVMHERIDRWRRLMETERPDKEILWIHPDPDDEDFFLAPEFTFDPVIQRQIMRTGECAAHKALNRQRELAWAHAIAQPAC